RGYLRSDSGFLYSEHRIPFQRSKIARNLYRDDKRSQCLTVPVGISPENARPRITRIRRISFSSNSWQISAKSLSGLARKTGGFLFLYNRIYGTDDSARRVTLNMSYSALEPKCAC